MSSLTERAVAVHGLAMLQAASLAVDHAALLTAAAPQRDGRAETPRLPMPPTRPSNASLTALLNPAPPTHRLSPPQQSHAPHHPHPLQQQLPQPPQQQQPQQQQHEQQQQPQNEHLPPGFVLGKDGKLKKKRGRKPTPGLTDEDRRQARLLKNRRTAEISRRRKLALLNRLTEERDQATAHADALRRTNDYLLNRLAAALATSVPKLLHDDPLAAGPPPCDDTLQSDVSCPPSVATDSDDDRACSVALLPPASAATPARMQPPSRPS